MKRNKISIFIDILLTTHIINAVLRFRTVFHIGLLNIFILYTNNDVSTISIRQMFENDLNAISNVTSSIETSGGDYSIVIIFILFTIIVILVYRKFICFIAKIIILI